MPDDQSTIALARRFFDAVEAGVIATVRACYASDARIWHNTDRLEQTPSENEATLKGLVKRIGERVYADRRLQVFPGGFVQQHTLTGRRKHDGEAVRLPCAIVCRVENGLITRLDEYFDSAHVATFRKFANS